MALTKIKTDGLGDSAVTSTKILDATITSDDLGSGVGGGATGGGSDDIFYENSKTVTTDYTLTTNKNAISAGPITINTGKAVTIPSGSVWIVL